MHDSGIISTTDTSDTILVVDDESGIVASLSKIFHREGWRVVTASGGEQALEILRKQTVAVMLTDLMMPKMDGMQLLRAARAIHADCEVVLMTAYGTVENAVDAMKEGAYDFVTKPLKRAHVVRTVRNALEKAKLVVENRALRKQLAQSQRSALVGSSPAWRQTEEIAMQAAPSSATCLLLGESGTGKELLARAIHAASPRASKPFIAVNCSAIPESILEGELFGYEKGAFTGAHMPRPGRFEAADGGTLFLDEIGDMPVHLQVKLLRVLQEGEIERLGASGKVRPIDIRVIAATHRDLAGQVQNGLFREDLYYRLNVIPIALPPLRDRREDILLLAQHFLERHAAKNNKAMRGFRGSALEALKSYSWPGNVRELENTIERCVVLSKAQTIQEADLPLVVRNETAGGSNTVMTFAVGTPLETIEMQVIEETLRQTGGDKKLAAKLLGIATRTIYRRLEGQSEHRIDTAAASDKPSQSQPQDNEA